MKRGDRLWQYAENIEAFHEMGMHELEFDKEHWIPLVKYLLRHSWIVGWGHLWVLWSIFICLYEKPRRLIH